MFKYQTTVNECKKFIRPIRRISTSPEVIPIHFLQDHALEFVINNDMKIGIEYEEYTRLLESDSNYFNLEHMEIKNISDIRSITDYMDMLYLNYESVKLIFDTEEDAIMFKLACM